VKFVRFLLFRGSFWVRDATIHEITLSTEKETQIGPGAGTCEAAVLVCALALHKKSFYELPVRDTCASAGLFPPLPLGEG